MSPLALAWRYRAHLTVVGCGLLALAGALERGLLPESPIGALLVGYLVYALGAGGATLALLLVIAPLLDRETEGDRSA